MASCVKNIRNKNYQNLIIVFQVTAKNVGDIFLRHSVLQVRNCWEYSTATTCTTTEKPAVWCPLLWSN